MQLKRAAAALSVLTLVACVGSEPRQAERDAAELGEVHEDVASREPNLTTTYRDTIQPVGYEIFQETLASRSPRKILVRIVVLEPASRDQLGKTLRVALDSLGRADRSTVAVRGILYVVHASDRRRGNLVPTVWGEWIPPEGWDSASSASRSKPYRTYIVYGQPGWNMAAPEREASDG